jgi:hypothetical protein
VSRPAVSGKRLALTANGANPIELKTPYRNGTSHVIFEPLDFIAKLAALVPKRVKKPDKPEAPGIDGLDKSPAERHCAMTWMQRLKRIFNNVMKAIAYDFSLLCCLEFIHISIGIYK